MIAVRPITYSLLVSLLIATACSSSKETSDWREFPRDRAIQVFTKNGNQYAFDSWTLTQDSTFVGLSELATQVIPIENINSVRLVDEQWDTIIIVGGVILGLLLIWLIIDFLSNRIPVPSAH